MAVLLVEETRGEVVESLSRGDIAVTNREGQLLFYAGDPGKYTFMRSAAKPIQAMEVVLSGAGDYFGFNDRELAIMCASHFGQPMHRQTVEGILNKIGLTRDHILAGAVTSRNPDYALELARKGLPADPLFNDCSGKHAGMLAVCRYKGYPVENYTDTDHPLQQEILQTIASITDCQAHQITLGIDGCSLPVHALPLDRMARAYARLANPGHLSQPHRKAARIIYDAMNRNPEMIAGTNGFCSDLLRLTSGKMIAKIGAQGIYCIGIQNKNRGLAVKMEDGSMKRLPPAVISILDQLDVLDQEEARALDQYRKPDNLNDARHKVGEIRPAFQLRPIDSEI